MYENLIEYLKYETDIEFNKIIPENLEYLNSKFMIYNNAKLDNDIDGKKLDILKNEFISFLNKSVKKDDPYRPSHY